MGSGWFGRKQREIVVGWLRIARARVAQASCSWACMLDRWLGTGSDLACRSRVARGTYNRDGSIAEVRGGTGFGSEMQVVCGVAGPMRILSLKLWKAMMKWLPFYHSIFLTEVHEASENSQLHCSLIWRPDKKVLRNFINVHTIYSRTDQQDSANSKAFLSNLTENALHHSSASLTTYGSHRLQRHLLPATTTAYWWPLSPCRHPPPNYHQSPTTSHNLPATHRRLSLATAGRHHPLTPRKADHLQGSKPQLWTDVWVQEGKNEQLQSQCKPISTHVKWHEQSIKLYGFRRKKLNSYKANASLFQLMLNGRSRIIQPTFRREPKFAEPNPSLSEKNESSNPHLNSSGGLRFAGGDCGRDLGSHGGPRPGSKTLGLAAAAARAPKIKIAVQPLLIQQVYCAAQTWWESTIIRQKKSQTLDPIPTAETLELLNSITLYRREGSERTQQIYACIIGFALRLVLFMNSSYYTNLKKTLNEEVRVKAEAAIGLAIVSSIHRNNRLGTYRTKIT
ncbi:hypothetical protein IEQ34_026906 [Dendrobium chrysotoxum]|uniref:Uncharacterized protein n=1 Tax=Dendrobium chrysotoxum TaxID=161865 RepID=A0AAV7FKS4_DENCH|nr:hypothetical protein IEQ34_026906 [Dendrobium chrysotoxum]